MFESAPTVTFNFVVWGILFLVVLVKVFKSICLVPTKSAYVVERLGKYYNTLNPGFHALIPFFDRVAFIQDLKERTLDVPPQDCFTKDEVKVEVDGVIYISVIDPAKASYGITDFEFAATQLAQTTTRSVIGTLALDQTFEERDMISAKVVEVLNHSGETWGIMVHRYEVKNLSPPRSVQDAMEKQVNAERERLAVVAKAEAEKQERINMSEGKMTEMINHSEGEMQRQINEAEGRAAEILAISVATAESITKISKVMNMEGGEAALRLQLAEKYLTRMGALAKDSTRIVLPADLTDLEGLLKKMDVLPS